MYDLKNRETKRQLDKIGRTMMQQTVERALEEGYSHPIITAGFIKQAYTVMRLTLPLSPEERKELFIRLCAEMADAIEAATKDRA